LPGHPLFRQKVLILQKGSTNTQEWCLISHPEQQGFNYRISSRWLDDKMPDLANPMTIYQKEFALGFHQLQKLAELLKFCLKNSHVERCVESLKRGQPQQANRMKLDASKEKRANTNNMDEHSSASENKAGINTSIFTDPEKK